MSTDSKKNDLSITSQTVHQTHQLAQKLAHCLDSGDVLCLQGELGSGKTCFVKGMAPVFGVDGDQIQSPTFTLIHEYSRPGYLPLYHMDCYRLEDEREALEIGMEDYLYGSGISVIEWPERIPSFIPEECVWIRIDILDRETRQFFISNLSVEIDSF